MGVRSLGNTVSSFRNKFGRTGIEAAKPGAGTAKATGGNISFAGGKTIHIFLSSGDLNNNSGSDITNADYLVVAGGGGGGAANASADGAAGGGAGGLRTSSPNCPGPLRGSQITISTGPNTVVVGGGCAGGQF